METGFRKIDSLVLDGSGSFDEDFDDENVVRKILPPEERDVLIKEMAKKCEISEERFREILADAGVEA